jgi:hypothetical protein
MGAFEFIATGIGQTVSDEIALYPNPVNGSLRISINDFNVSDVYIYSMGGQLLIQKKISNSDNMISTEELTPGMYFVKMISNGKSLAAKIIKQ